MWKIIKKGADCPSVIQTAIKRKGELTKKPVEAVMFKLLTSAHPYLQLLQEHQDHIFNLGVACSVSGQQPQPGISLLHTSLSSTVSLYSYSFHSLMFQERVTDGKLHCPVWDCCVLTTIPVSVKAKSPKSSQLKKLSVTWGCWLLKKSTVHVNC